MINERIFGSPISGQVRKKLEDRQRVAGEVAFGDSIEAVYPDIDGNNQADLSSRTPFVRMWTSVKLIRPADVYQVLKDLGPADYTKEFYEELAENQSALDEIQRRYPQAKLIEDNDENSETFKHMLIVEGEDRPQVDYSSKLYIVGDYNYQTGYGSVEPNESNQADEINQGGLDSSDLFPVELQNNPLLKPQAGITSVTSETEGTLGVIKRTVVNFVVHNFEDFDKIYNRYFLKPGATVFVDFGHSSVKNLYNPNDLINAPDIKKFLFESNVIPGYEDVDGNQVEESIENIGEIAKNQGDLEVLQGIVVDYNAKILENGSVECSVSLISANSALLDFQIDDATRRHVKDVLARSTQYLGLSATLNNVQTYTGWNSQGQVIDGSFADNEEIELITPNKDTSATDIVKANEFIESQALQALSSKNFTPDGNEIRTGIYVNSLEADDIYVCWGFIEDIVINANFGFGQNDDDINKGNNFRVRMDSSNQFTTWNKVFLERQQTLSAVAEESPVFIYPEWWGDSDPQAQNSVKQNTPENGSYNYFNNKYPKIHYGDTFGEHTSVDEEKSRIPIREIFINMEIITKAFGRNKTVKNALNDMLMDINNDSDGVFDWKVVLGDIDSELMIIDNNRPDINQRIFDSGVVAEEDIEKAEREQFENMFIFNIMSPNSIVKDYNLEFKLPQGNIGNMYAIQGMSHESQIFPTSDMVDNALAINSLDDDSLSIIYQPDNGGYRNMQINSRENKDGVYFDVYDAAKYLLDNNIYKSAAIRRSDDIINAKTFFDSDTEVIEEDDESKKKQFQEQLIQLNIDVLTFANKRVVNNFRDYYKLIEIQEISLKTRPNLLPYTLSLTTYGIGSIQPGDAFRVDYLPKQHFKNTFLQTMKVTNNINSDGWFTSLDTQYRILSDKKQKNYVNLDIDNTFLSPHILDSLNLQGFQKIDTSDAVRAGTKVDYINLIKPYITKLKVYPKQTEFIELILSFKTTEKLSDELTNNFYSNREYKINGDNVSEQDRQDHNLFIENRNRLTPLLMVEFTGKNNSKIRYVTPPPIRFEPNKEYLLLIQAGTAFVSEPGKLLDFHIKILDKPVYVPGRLLDINNINLQGLVG